MKRLFMVLIVVLFGFVLVGCNNVSSDDKLYLIDGVNLKTQECKPTPSLAFSYKIKKENDLNNKIIVKLCFGTSVTKEDIDISVRDWPNPTEGYKAEIFIINKIYCDTIQEENNVLSNPYNYINRTIVKSFDNFYSENYPFPVDEKYSNSLTYELPNSLFEEKSGEILIGISMFDQCYGFVLSYKIIDEKIYFEKGR